MEKTFRALAMEYGVVGAGGAGFPTHIKLNSEADTIIVNGAECEPLITVDQALLARYGEVLAETLDQLRIETGAVQAIIAVKAKHKALCGKLKEILSRYPAARLSELEDRYPAGDETVLVYETTGRLVPQAGLPLRCGVIVVNVETLWNLSEAQKGISVYRKWVTIAGAVKNPGVYLVPVGAGVDMLLGAAGGATVENFAAINGGPMMGRLIDDLREPVTKTTKAVLILDESSPVIQNFRRPLSASLRQAKSLCCQCSLCSDLCPRKLLGYQIRPNRTILAAAYSTMAAGFITEAFLCSECGACDLYACPMGLSPRKVNQALKQEMMKHGVKNPHAGVMPSVNPLREYRRIPTARLIRRLGLQRYDSPALIHDIALRPKKIRLPLKQHVGIPSVPVVRIGDRVEEGQLAADIADSNAPGSRIFAGIGGIVSDVGENGILITEVSE